MSSETVTEIRFGGVRQAGRLTVAGYVVMANHHYLARFPHSTIQCTHPSSPKRKSLQPSRLLERCAMATMMPSLDGSFWLTRQAELNWPDLQ